MMYEEDSNRRLAMTRRASALCQLTNLAVLSFRAADRT